MKILVDADSCPVLVRETILRASVRTGIRAIFAANRLIPGIGGDRGMMVLCPPGDDAADHRIISLAEPGDLAITRDIVLAARLVAAAITVIDDRGRVFDQENIGECLSLKDFMVGLAEHGLGNGRGGSYGKRELKTFADSFDRILSRLIREATLAQGKAPGSV
ncbi:DUF188 domain-containing protein [Treponema sp. TIM-1]|uniref:DUF188 domain-containing protein n=1 Tax=Treponema sp. TIM-1 TaxID=2898417 RepID=UPI0039816659